MMKPNGGGEPNGELAAGLDKQFGSFAVFKERFINAAAAQPGNGWMWLTLDGAGLRVEMTANEDNPLAQGRPVLLGLDLWEHAYRTQYTNRADYVKAWFNVVNWHFVAERYAKLGKESANRR